MWKRVRMKEAAEERETKKYRKKILMMRESVEKS